MAESKNTAAPAAAPIRWSEQDPTRRAHAEKRHRKTLASEAAYEVDALLRMALATRFTDPTDQVLAMRGVMIRVKDLNGVVTAIQNEDGIRTSERTVDLERIVYGETLGLDGEPSSVLTEAANG